MSGQPWRNETGGMIDRARPLRFTFNGRWLRGFEGDTLASALLANNVHLVGRSFKYHRPRGIFAAGAEDPNAWMQIGRGGHEEANVAATTAELYEGLDARSTNCWPGVGFDLGAVSSLMAPLLVAGFYYKTFMNPHRLWPIYERTIRNMAGAGRAPSEPDSDTYDQVHETVQILVVGGGPAGLAAALAAARCGASVILAEASAHLGGDLLAVPEPIDGVEPGRWIEACRTELDTNPRVRVLTRTTVFGYYDHDYCVALERLTDHLPPAARTGKRQRLRHIRAQRVVIATGAHERPLAFANNDRPGIMLASAARAYANRYAVRPGRRVVVFTNNDSAYGAALDLKRAGVDVGAVVDVREDPAARRGEIADAGIETIAGSAVLRAKGARRVTGVDIAPFGLDGTQSGSTTRHVDCDLLCVSGGWSPVVHLFSQSGGKLAYDDAEACLLPERGAQSTHVVGAANGAFSLARCLADGIDGGGAAAEAIGFGRPPMRVPSTQGTGPVTPILAVWSKSAPTPRDQKHSFVDLFADVTLFDIGLAVREGYVAVEHLKRYTAAGMGTDQGKTGNLIALATLGELTGATIADVGTTTFRPPYTPVTFGALAGGRSGELYQPLRRTSIDRWHAENGAVFEDFGLWRRPRHYARPGMSTAEAVMAEARNVRDNVGVVDVSTLGKIHLRGPDVAEFLNRVYTNRWDTLRIGRCRYGLMLREDGMVFDDGVTARLGELDYHMTTTTGGAAAVYRWLDDLLQTDWPELRVHMASVTTQWAAVAIAGPNARALLARLTDDIDCSPEALPFMAVGEGTVVGLPARVFAISFTGEASFEINVPARYGVALWAAIMAAGEAFGVSPFGVEAMDWLRMEKGHFIVGRDTDGTVTPGDLGLQRLVSEKKGVDFLGKRSLRLADLARPDRLHLVGLHSDDGKTLIPEGGQLITAMRRDRPLPREGHVTSSCRSPSEGTPIALALLENGHNQIGEKLQVYSEGRVYPVTVTDPHFFDPAGDHLRQ